MSSYPRMKHQFPWKPHVKKSEKVHQHLSQPQYEGIPGWLLLSHNRFGEPEAIFVDKNEKQKPLQIILDERMFSDTVLRVVQIQPHVYVAYDIRWLNGKNLFETLNYQQRKEKLDELLGLFHSPDFTALVTVEDVPVGTTIRGYEYYDDAPGTLGVFLPVEE